jgi:hypothetical protein
LSKRLPKNEWEWNGNVKVEYGNKNDADKEHRDIVIFSKKKNKVTPRASPVLTLEEKNLKGDKDKEFLKTRQADCLSAYKRIFGNNLLPAFGTHSMKENSCKALITSIGLKRKDVCWEIGCGNPKLSFLLSASSTNTVVATDLRKYSFENLHKNSFENLHSLKTD